MTMKRTTRDFISGLLWGGGILVLVILGVMPQLFAADSPTTATSTGIPSLPNGAIVRTDSQPNVYLIEQGRKRWIASESAFRAQGLRWDQVTVVSASDLNRVMEGEQITEQSSFVLPTEVGSLPDLTPLVPRDLRLITQNGRVHLNFGTGFWNKGGAAFNVVTGPQVPGGNPEFLQTYQRIQQTGGTTRLKQAGTLQWHVPHNHYHNDHFIDYVLEPVSIPSGSATPSLVQKTTFCLRDDLLIAGTLAGAPPRSTFNGCTKEGQGVSVGWADWYPRNLPGQVMDVHDLPAGIYRLSFVIDPQGFFVEGNKNDNVSMALIEIDPRRSILRTLAVGSPFATPENRFPDGMLIRAEGDPRVYVIRQNKKRWLHTEEVFTSYGYAWSSIYVLPRGVVDVIPLDTIVRAKGSGDIYKLNPEGYKRRLLNPEVFRSYGLTPANITEVSPQELASYPNTQLIIRRGDNTVYSIANKQSIGPLEQLAALGHDRASVHLVNETDFNAYGIGGNVAQPVETVVQGLNVPWDIVFLPDGDMLVTERSGSIRRIGKQAATITIPSVLQIGEGGLMGMALHPDFPNNQFVYLYFTTSDSGNENRVVRFTLDGNRLVEDRLIVGDIPAAEIHDGGQIAFGPDGLLYITTGDANNTSAAQDRSSLAGKTLRLTAEGEIPSDNPFGTAVWSYGHRNAQGIAWNNQGRLWQTEHGPSGSASGFDELNRVERGQNYGWPTIQGDQSREGMTRPIRHSGANETWAPAGIAFLNGRLYFAGLRGSTLYEAILDQSGNITELRKHLAGEYGRLRAVVAGPDGFLYVSTSNRDGRGTVRAGDDKILRIRPSLF